MSKANLFLLAAPRSGSTLLSESLSQHPEINLAKIKEPNFFSNHEFTPEYVKRTHLNDIDPEFFDANKNYDMSHIQFAIFRDVNLYESLFPSNECKYNLDASTTYLNCAESPKLIKEYNPDSKAIILIREPKDRIISHYRLAIRTGRVSSDLKNCLIDEERSDNIDESFLLKNSYYSEVYKNYLINFEDKDIKVVFFEDLIEDYSKVVNDVFEFLGLEKLNVKINSDFRNEGLSPRFRRVNYMLTRFGIKSLIKKKLTFKQVKFIKSLVLKKEKDTISEDCLKKYEPIFINDARELKSLGLKLPKRWRYK